MGFPDSIGNSCAAVADSKLSARAGSLSSRRLSTAARTRSNAARLQGQNCTSASGRPQTWNRLSRFDSAPGLLYLENAYVVPGGRFNEMYGWDSYFIIRGLLRDGRVNLARGMVDNFFFEIENYGAVLNANRTYYLTRSQPPFLSSMVMAVHLAQKAAGQDDRAWLETAYAYVKRDHAMWTQPPHLAGNYRSFPVL